MTAEDEVDVSFTVHDESGASVIVDFGGVGGIGSFPQCTNTCLKRARPLCGIMFVSADVGILMGALESDVGDAFKVLGAGVLHGADGLAKTIVCEPVGFFLRMGELVKQEKWDKASEE